MSRTPASRRAGRGIVAAEPIREQYLVTQFDTDDEPGPRIVVCWPVRLGGADLILRLETSRSPRRHTTGEVL